MTTTYINIKGEKNYTHEFENFMKAHGIHRIIGFSGGANDQLNGIPADDPLQIMYKEYTEALHKRIITDTLTSLRGYRIAILTGGTRFGVPEAASRIAKELGFKTIGVLPQAGAKHALSDEILDLKLTVDSMIGAGAWGDEGAVWTSTVDGLVVIGGGAGTLTECSHVMKINEGLVAKEKTPKVMVPIQGTGGLAEQLQHLWAKPDIREVSMPNFLVHTGKEAADVLRDKLQLDTFFDYQIQQK